MQNILSLCVSRVTRFVCVVLCVGAVSSCCIDPKTEWMTDRNRPYHPSVPTIMIQTPTNESCQQAAAARVNSDERELTRDLNGLGVWCVCTVQPDWQASVSGVEPALHWPQQHCCFTGWPWLVLFRVTTAVQCCWARHCSHNPAPTVGRHCNNRDSITHHKHKTEHSLATKKRIRERVLVTWYRVIGSRCEVSSVLWRGHWHNQQSVMEFKNVVFNAARDGKLRRLKVSPTLNPEK